MDTMKTILLLLCIGCAMAQDVPIWRPFVLPPPLPPEATSVPLSTSLASTSTASTPQVSTSRATSTVSSRRLSFSNTSISTASTRQLTFSTTSIPLRTSSTSTSTTTPGRNVTEVTNSTSLTSTVSSTTIESSVSVSSTTPEANWNRTNQIAPQPQRGNWTWGKLNTTTTESTNSTTANWTTTTPLNTTTPIRTTSTPRPTPAVPMGPVITSRTYKDYEAACPENLPVRAFSYKIIDNGTDKDYALKAVCYQRVTFENGTDMNLSSAECQYKKAFSIDYDDVSPTDSNYMCDPGEYVSGVQSEFWEGARLLRLRCCKSAQLSQVADYGCRDWRMDQSQAMMQYRRSPKCPIEVLTGIGLKDADSDKVLSRYCGLADAQSTFSAICEKERREELNWLSGWTASRTPVPFDTPAASGRKKISSGDKTDPNGDFTLTCPDYEAIEKVEVEDTGDDLSFIFQCNQVAPEIPTRVRMRYTDFKTMTQILQEDTHCDSNRSEVLCGVDSYLAEADVDAVQHRHYSFRCCQLANAVAATGMKQNMTFFRRDHANVSRSGYFLEKLLVAYRENPRTPVVLLTGWSAFNHSDNSNYEGVMNSAMNSRICYANAIALVVFFIRFVMRIC